MKLARICLLAVAVGLAGCDNVSEIYKPSTGGHAGADISPQKTWTITGTLSTPQAAVDGDLATAARSEARNSEAELTIDLKRMCVFQTVIIEHGAERDGHGRVVSVSTSADGKVFLDRYTGPGSRRVTILCMPVPVLARYVRLKATGMAPHPWNVAEVYLQ